MQGALDGVRLYCVAAGLDYTLVASQEGELFSFGDGYLGCLGHGDGKSKVLPERVQSLSPARGEVVAHVAAGARYEPAMALTAQGQVFVWGGGDSGKRPREVRALRGTRIKHTSTGAFRAYAVSEGGQLFWWDIDGDADVATDPTPTRVESLAGIHVVSVHGGHTQALVVSHDGGVYGIESPRFT